VGGLIPETLYINLVIVIFSAFSSAAGLTTDLTAGRPNSPPIVIYRNNAIQMSFFLIIVLMLSALKTEYDKKAQLLIDLQDTLSALRKTKDELEWKSEDLVRSNAELEQFAYVAAHDLKQPLIAAGGHINRLQRYYKDTLDSDAKASIGNALKAIARMEALINTLLAYARAGTRVEDLKFSDFNEIIEWATINLQTEIEKNFAVVTRDPLPTLLADHIQMVQLFQNLIGNSIKFR
jgi:light-regulated signal transduction histidine kinase (bacteriophytochrome)